MVFQLPGRLSLFSLFRSWWTGNTSSRISMMNSFSGPLPFHGTPAPNPISANIPSRMLLGRAQGVFWNLIPFAGVPALTLRWISAHVPIESQSFWLWFPSIISGSAGKARRCAFLSQKNATQSSTKSSSRDPSNLNISEQRKKTQLFCFR